MSAVIGWHQYLEKSKIKDLEIDQKIPTMTVTNDTVDKYICM